jgi:hypothetical protein
MSFVHLTIIKDHTVYQLYVHYRTALRLMEQGPLSVRNLPGKYRDAGYLIIDHDKRTIVNGQDAFALPKLKGMEITEVP